MVGDLVIWQKIVDMNVYVIPVCSKFPKNQRFVLGQQIQNKILDMASTAIEANKARNKTALLDRLDTELEQFRFLIRTSVDLKIMPARQYEYIAKLSGEIGRLIGGRQRKFKA
jgi:hypothetical protein